jgi:hypothetical protein
MNRSTRPILAAAALLALAVPSAASAKSGDRDRDKLPDKWEKLHKLNTHRHDAKRDNDRDGLRNLAEYKYGFDPRDADSDDDGIKDGKEQAGTVVSFANGVLTISTVRGATIAGQVTADTEIDCESLAIAPTPAPAKASHNGDDDGPGNDRRNDNAATPATPSPSSHHDDDDDDDERSDADHSSPSGRHNDDDDDEDGPGCSATVADLVPGAKIHEAELKVSSTADVWEELDLLK